MTTELLRQPMQRHFHPWWCPNASGTCAITMKTGIQEALLKTVLPRQGECGRYQRVIRPTCHCGGACPRGGGAAIQRASIGDCLSLYAGCTLDRTLPADATGLDSGLRRNDMVRGPLIRLVRQHNRCHAVWHKTLNRSPEVGTGRVSVGLWGQPNKLGVTLPSPIMKSGECAAARLQRRDGLC